ncbi:MAG: hybrid sensor histidine kinase/response regulator [Micavibrio sp.]|nr:hybrid sensor histidine kinase/response regulator [Micavibrio sp.]
MKQILTLWIVILTTAFAVHAGTAIAFIQKTDLSEELLFILLIGLGLAGLSVLSFIVLKINLQRQEKESQILMEVFEGSRAARLLTDSNSRTVYTNHKFCSLCNVSRKEAGLSSLIELFKENEDDYAKFRLMIENAERGNPDTLILAIGKGKGQQWLQVIAQPVASWAGYIHWRVDDITDRHQIEALIREEREKLVNFTDHAPVGFFSVDETGRFLFVNATLARWLGADVDSLLETGRLHQYLVEPPKRARPYDIVMGGGEKQTTEIYMKGLAGSTLYVSINQSVVDEGDGRIRTNAVVHDLTSERQMIKALQASENRFQKFFEEAPLGVIMLNEQGKIADCNPTFATMLESDTEKLVGTSFADLVLQEDRLTASQAIKSLSDGDQFKNAMEITLQRGEKICAVQMHARRFKESQSTVLHFIDLTDKKALEAQFVQSQKMQAVGQLAGGIAHDFNNLLTAMIGFCDLLLLRHKPGDPSFADISQIKQNSNRAANLVRQLLAFSRQQTLRPRVLDITDILTELSHLIRRLIGANIDFDVIHGADIGPIKVDEGQLEQVLINLAVNARDAMVEKGDNGGKLTITTSSVETKKTMEQGGERMPAGHWVKVDVTDTGCGIPHANLDRIFEPFFTTKKVGSGTGLGLATVFGIIKQTGGYIFVDSVVGKGTTFSLYFPRYEAKESDLKEEKKERVQEQDLTGTASIMLVEDEDAVRTFSARALRNKGYEVLEANSGEAAQDLMKKDPKIDLLITDVIMPGIDGPTLAKQILKKKPDLTVILISGYTEDRFKDDLGKNVHFLPKPFTLQQLAAKVKDVLNELD